MGTLALGRHHLGIALHNRNHVAADRVRHLDKHQPNRTTADHGHRIADFDSGLVQTAQHTSQGFHHRRILVAHIVGDGQHIGFDNAARNANIFSIGAIVEQQVFAEILLMFLAEETDAAGSRVEGDDSLPFLELANSRSDFVDRPRQLVPEKSRRRDHAGVVAAAIHFHVRAAGECHLDFDQNLPFVQARDWNLFDLHVLFAVEDGSRHLACHKIPSHALPG